MQAQQRICVKHWCVQPMVQTQDEKSLMRNFSGTWAAYTGFGLVFVSGLFQLSGCAAPVMNTPIESSALSADPAAISKGGYRIDALPDGDSSNELLVVLVGSGGGKRSSAFSYGVLRGLRDYPITVNGQRRRLLDELDTYAAVSGGAFPAAYYGLYRERTFEDFEHDFLKVDVNSYIWGLYFLPWRWQWMFSPGYGRGDEMATIYDRLIFHGATFADLERRGRPVISIDATDINYGTVFSFTQDEFDLICSNLSTYPIANAVAASNGLPILFTPVTLTNYAKQCAGREPPWIAHAAAPTTTPREHQLGELARLYLDPNKTRYVHLMDGGIADNLAMRFAIDKALAYGDDARRLHQLGLDHVRRILLISADGEAKRDSDWPRQRSVSDLGQIIASVSGSQIDSYDFETLVLAEDHLQRFVSALRRIRCAEGPVVDGHACDDVQGFFAHLSIGDATDENVRARLQKIPTGLTVSSADVDDLVTVGAQSVRDSKVLAEFSGSL